MGRRSPHQEGHCPTGASLTPVSVSAKKSRFILPVLPSTNSLLFLSDSDPQMDSCSLPLLWTGTASQTQSTSLLPFHQRIPRRVSAARSFTACWVADLCPGRSLWTWGTSGPLRARRHQQLRDVEEEEGRKEEEGNHGRRSFTN